MAYAQTAVQIVHLTRLGSRGIEAYLRHSVEVQSDNDCDGRVEGVQRATAVGTDLVFFSGNPMIAADSSASRSSR